MLFLGLHSAGSEDLILPVCLVDVKNKSFEEHGRLHFRNPGWAAAEEAQLWDAHPEPAAVPDAGTIQAWFSPRCLSGQAGCPATSSKATLLHGFPLRAAT